RELAHHLDAWDDQRAAAGDDLEAERLARLLVRPVVEPRDDERLVRFGDPPHRSKQHDEDGECNDDDADDENSGSLECSHVLPPAPARSRLGDDYRPWRIVLDDHHSGSDRDALRIARVRVEVFCTSTHGEHALPDPTGTDRPRHAPDFPHDLVRDGPPPLRSKTPVRTGRDTGCYAA